MMPVAGIVMYLVLRFFRNKAQSINRFFPLMIVLQALAIVGPMLILRSRLRRTARLELANLGVPICLACSYDLTGNESGTCPECGTKVDAGQSSEAARPPG